MTTTNTNLAGIPKDVFRRIAIELTHEQKKLIDEFKFKAEGLYEMVCLAEFKQPKIDKRHMAFSKAKLEECVMWFTKGVSG